MPHSSHHAVPVVCNFITLCASSYAAWSVVRSGSVQRLCLTGKTAVLKGLIKGLSEKVPTFRARVAFTLYAPLELSQAVSVAPEVAPSVRVM